MEVSINLSNHPGLEQALTYQSWAISDKSNRSIVDTRSGKLVAIMAAPDGDHTQGAANARALVDMFQSLQEALLAQ